MKLTNNMKQLERTFAYGLSGMENEIAKVEKDLQDMYLERDALADPSTATAQLARPNVQSFGISDPVGKAVAKRDVLLLKIERIEKRLDELYDRKEQFDDALMRLIGAPQDAELLRKRLCTNETWESLEGCFDVSLRTLKRRYKDILEILGENLDSFKEILGYDDVTV